MFKLGLIINPLAGLGGSVALKGSDQLAQKALSLGAKPMAGERMSQALAPLSELKQRIRVLTGSGDMGAELARKLGFETCELHRCQRPSTAEDTKTLVKAMADHRPDLILFAGGDGTARDICSTLSSVQPVLGVPSGVKIHSGVFGLTPKACGLVVAQMVRGELLSVTDGEVRDIDEKAFRKGLVKTRYFGEMPIPEALRYVQAVKQSGQESEQLVLDDIAADVVENMKPDWQYVMGSGTTVAAVMAELGLVNSLLGIDVVADGQVVASDVTAAQLLERVRNRPTKLLLTPMGGQGHLFGRGNQQLSPEVIRLIGKDNIMLLATKSKLKGLNGWPMLADTGDEALNRELAGHYLITTGYRDQVLYPLANPEHS